jgi:hypothetical protein
MAAKQGVLPEATVCRQATSPGRSGSAPPRAAPPLLGQRTGTCGSPGHRTRTRQEPLSYPSKDTGSARLAPHQSSAPTPRRRKTSPGKVLLRGCKSASSLTIPKMPGAAGQPAEQALGGGERVLRLGPLAGRHTQTAGHNPRRPSPGARQWPPSSRRSRRPAAETSWSDCLVCGRPVDAEDGPGCRCGLTRADAVGSSGS